MADYFVAPASMGGNNGQSGLNVGSPWETLTYAIPHLGPGSTLNILGNISTPYQEDLFYELIPPGTSWLGTDKVRLVNYPGHTPWLKPPQSAYRCLDFRASQQFIEIDGLNLDGRNVQYDCVKINNGDGNDAHHIRLKNLEIWGSHTLPGGGLRPQKGGSMIIATNIGGGVGNNEFLNLYMHGHGTDRFDHGFYIQSPDNLIDGVTVTDFTGGAVQVYNGYVGAAGCVRNIVRNMFVYGGTPLDPYGVGSSCVGILPAGNDGQYYNNIIRNLAQGDFENNALWVFAGDRNYLGFNTIYACIDGVVIGYDGPVDHNIVQNNISFACTGSNGNYWPRNETNTTQDHNVFASDPQFVVPTPVNPVDFKLKTTSPAYNAGTYVSPNNIVTFDFGRNVRPQGSAPDIGAWEFDETVASGSSPVLGIRNYRSHKGSPRQYRTRERMRGTVHGLHRQRR